MEANEINVNVSFSCEGTRWNLETDRLNERSVSCINVFSGSAFLLLDVITIKTIRVALSKRSFQPHRVNAAKHQSEPDLGDNSTSRADQPIKTVSSIERRAEASQLFKIGHHRHIQ
ncbi:hypothetical protein RRG08_028956 [Elysia crispata]|uniref:Uncharacterized protein n=1 Tax=Elysia crispata TaxID=231223 RepID=A0AAE1AQ32_9GAST|nr:hypothetical protein RRG08_028956 [Elysia crispata]